MFILSFVAGVAMFFVPVMPQIPVLGPWSIFLPGLVGTVGFVLLVVGGVLVLTGPTKG
jgi:hypothetical protein